jgi:hypothetical protein
MKKVIIFLFVLTAASTLYADFKIMGGVNLSRYIISPKEDGVKWDYERGFLGGIGLEKSFSSYMLLEVNFLFFQKGSKVEFSNFPDLVKKYRINAFSVPVLLRGKFFYGSSPYAVGGVEFSSILAHKAKFDGEDAVDLKENTKRIDLGCVLGCGYELELEEHLYLFIEARYHHGLVNIMSHPVGDQSMKNSSVVILIGIRS